MGYWGKVRRILQTQLFLVLGIGALIWGVWPDKAKQERRAKLVEGCKITRVVDGDSLELNCPNTDRKKARITGLDAPEIYGDCEAEKVLAMQAKNYLRTRVRSAKDVQITHYGRDKYNRMLIKLELDGKDIAPQIIDQGLARLYTGGARLGWCG